MRLATAAALIVIAVSPGLACDPAHTNALRDQARAQENQAEHLRQLERIERDRNRMLDRSMRSRQAR